MPPRLIVNADDFGLTPGVNETIAALHAAGAVTSATLMANGPAFHHAVALAKAHPTLGVGCHVVLTDGVPVSDPATIPTLLEPGTEVLRPVLSHFLRAVLLGRVRSEHIRSEAIAQIRTLQLAGLHVTHIDTHKHTHILPGVARPLLEAAEETGVRAVRDPFERSWSLRLGHPRPMRILSVAVAGLLQRRFLALPALSSGRVKTTDGTIGISATGRLAEPTLRQILAELPPGTWELVCHPGRNDADLEQITTRLRTTREIEADALRRTLGAQNSLAGALSSQPPRPRLIHYGDLLDRNQLL